MAHESRRTDDDVEELLRARSAVVGPPDDEADLKAMYRYLIGAGVPFDQLRAATERGDRLPGLVEYRLLSEGERHDVDDVASRVGLGPAAVAEVLRALGIAVPAPGVATLSESDLAAVRAFAEVESLFGEETVLRFARVMRASIGRVAEAAVAMFGVSVEDPLRQRGATNAELAAVTDRALTTLPLVPELFGALFQRQALDAIRRMAVLHGTDSTYDTVTASVGFADLVGSTVWSQHRTPRELADALGEFERLALASLSGRARLVKTIGDEVMFFAPTPGEACRTALNLVRAVAGEPRLPALRVGLAHGRVVALDGDLYGSVVNLAARLVHQAEPGRVVS
ncbi:MAG TPA: adenylate/guanylate cyclase domain-containing protein, partial [Pseudonocardia sp.]|nr:adenylate/guanylate cyclase domain-containing protein [Pseudonocardia sp.]